MLRSTLPEPFKSYDHTKPVSIDQLRALRAALSSETARAVDRLISEANHGDISELLAVYYTNPARLDPEAFVILRRYGPKKKGEVLKAFDIIDATRRISRFTPSRYH
ncbi:MAG: hypothetical protein ACTJG2_02070 [Candidatus Saccharimonadales bacterium]